jgi:hypothetical protein
VRVALETVGFAASLVAALMTLVSAIRTVVLPRAAQSLLPRATVRAVRAAFSLRARSSSSYEQRDRTMAMLAPVALVAMLLAWLVVVAAAYSIMFFCLGRRSWSSSVQLSGSSLVTLGTTADPRLAPSILTYSEAGLGLLLVALFISYFPSIYGSFTRRETGVTLLEVRAGVPPRPSTMLIRYHLIDEPRFRLTELWRHWEAWFADIEESHSTFTILPFFRSPHPDRSWITAAGTVLDGAALWVAALEHPADPDAQLCLRAGFLALRRIADAFGIKYDSAPSPGDPVSVTRAEFEEVLDELDSAGLAVVPDRDAAWMDWRGWRVNYDTVLLALARLVEAPPAPWVSDRSPVSLLAGRRSTGWRSRRRR